MVHNESSQLGKRNNNNLGFEEPREKVHATSCSKCEKLPREEDREELDCGHCLCLECAQQCHDLMTNTIQCPKNCQPQISTPSPPRPTVSQPKATATVISSPVTSNQPNTPPQQSPQKSKNLRTSLNLVPQSKGVSVRTDRKRVQPGECLRCFRQGIPQQYSNRMCTECGYLCNKCELFHSKEPLLSNHPALIDKPPKLSRLQSPNCKIHEKFCDCVCITCRTPICSDCDHEDHTIKDFHNYVVEEEEKLLDSVFALYKGKVQTLEKELAQLKPMEEIRQELENIDKIEDLLDAEEKTLANTIREYNKEFDVWSEERDFWKATRIRDLRSKVRKYSQSKYFITFLFDSQLYDCILSLEEPVTIGMLKAEIKQQLSVEIPLVGERWEQDWAIIKNKARNMEPPAKILYFDNTGHVGIAKFVNNNWKQSLIELGKHKFIFDRVTA